MKRMVNSQHIKETAISCDVKNINCDLKKIRVNVKKLNVI